MTDFKKPECYSDADWQMVKGYMDGSSGNSPKSQSTAYQHGYRNGCSDRTGVPHERADVLRRRASMIPGITPQDELVAIINHGKQP